MEKLLYLKGYPEQIKPTLEVFAKYQDEPYPRNRTLIKENLYIKLLELRKNRKGIREKNATPESLILNQAIPACYTLELLFKDGRPKQTRITPEGSVLLKTLEKNNEDLYLKKLGKILIDFDKKHNKIIETVETIRKRPGDYVSFVSLIIALNKNGIDACEKIKNPTLIEEEELKKNGINYSKGSRLSDLLKYFQFSDIIITRANQLYLNDPRIKDIEEENILESIDKISDKIFFNALFKVYISERDNNKQGSYVPIFPHIRDIVCKELNISIEGFVQKLTSLPTVINGKQIHLAPAGVGKPMHQLTKFGKGFYYYIAIFERGESVV